MSTGTVSAELHRLPPFERVRRRGEELGHEWYESRPGQVYGRCPCPAHDDEHGSFSLGEGDDGRALVRCFGGCTMEEVCAALELPTWALNARGRRSRGLSDADAGRADLAVRRSTALLNGERADELREHEGWSFAAMDALNVGHYGPRRVAIPERDHRGRVVGSLLYVPRFERLPTDRAKGTEQGSTRGLVFRAGGLESGTVLVVEGGPCAVSALSLGWEPLGIPSATVGLERAAAHLLRDRDALVLPDADRKGREAAERALALLRPVARSVATVELWPDRDDGADVGDLLRDLGPVAAARASRSGMRSRVWRSMSAHRSSAAPSAAERRGSHDIPEPEPERTDHASTQDQARPTTEAEAADQAPAGRARGACSRSQRDRPQAERAARAGQRARQGPQLREGSVMSERQALSEGAIVSAADINTSPEADAPRVVLPIIGVGVERRTLPGQAPPPLPTDPPVSPRPRHARATRTYKVTADQMERLAATARERGVSVAELLEES